MKTKTNVKSGIQTNRTENQGTRGTLSRALFFRALIAVSLLAMAPAAVQADCLQPPAPPNGSRVPFTMTMQNQKWVSYTAGVLTSKNYAGVDLFTDGSAPAQLFNDRFATTTSTAAYASQPFDIHQADSVSLEISQVWLQPPHPINVWLTLKSWGGAQFGFVAKCDTSNNLLYGSFNDVRVVIALGTPF